MENLEPKKLEGTEFNNNFILGRLNLVDEDKKEPEGFLRLKPDLLSQNHETKASEKKLLDNLDYLFSFFENAKILVPDKICRPKGDTTFFTTAGVQHIETILRERGKLERKLFVISQPVIRSQFMDKIKDGTSTSFINFSVEAVRSNPDEFIDLCDRLIKLIVGCGADPRELRFQIENVNDRWGDKEFTKTVLTLYFNNTELAECVLIHDYPISENDKICIADVGFGVERLNWGVNKSRYYFPGFDKFYEEKRGENKIDSDKVTAIIDSMRTGVLIAGEGVIPSNHDAGYRLRQLSKRFVLRNQGVNFNVVELIHNSYEYWQKWSFEPNIGENKVVEIMRQENERNYNGLLLSMLEERGGPHVYVEINQPTVNFLKQLRVSLSKDAKEIVDEIIVK